MNLNLFSKAFHLFIHHIRYRVRFFDAGGIFHLDGDRIGASSPEFVHDALTHDFAGIVSEIPFHDIACAFYFGIEGDRCPRRRES